MKLPKFGLKTLVLGVAVYALVANYMVTTCLEMASAPDSFLNTFGVIGLAAFAVVSIALLKPARQVARNAKVDLAQLLGGVSVLVVALTAGGCTRIEPGYAGIKVNLSGTDKGVENTPVVTGWQFYNPLSTKVIEYPIFVQTATWTQSQGEGAGLNEEISFNSKENMRIAADISLSYKIERDKVPNFYVTYRADDLATFTHGYMRSVARNSFNEVGGHYAVEDILGPKQDEFLEAIKVRINSHLKNVGVVIEQFGFIGAPRAPTQITDAINAKIAATQSAQKAENELRTSEAEAKKAIARAQGEAASQIARAEGAAKAKIAMAEGEAKANQLMAQSITPALLEWRRLAIQEQAVNKWDGKRPTVEGTGSGMLLQVDTK